MQHSVLTRRHRQEAAILPYRNPLLSSLGFSAGAVGCGCCPRCDKNTQTLLELCETVDQMLHGLAIITVDTEIIARLKEPCDIAFPLELRQSMMGTLVWKLGSSGPNSLKAHTRALCDCVDIVALQKGHNSIAIPPSKRQCPSLIRTSSHPLSYLLSLRLLVPRRGSKADSMSACWCFSQRKIMRLGLVIARAPVEGSLRMWL